MTCILAPYDSYDCLSIFHRSFSLLDMPSWGSIAGSWKRCRKANDPTMLNGFFEMFSVLKMIWCLTPGYTTQLACTHNNLMHYALLPVILLVLFLIVVFSSFQFWTINVDARSLKLCLRQSKLCGWCCPVLHWNTQMYLCVCIHTNWKEAALTKNYKLHEQIGTNGHQETKEKPKIATVQNIKNPEKFWENEGYTNILSRVYAYNGHSLNGHRLAEGQERNDDGEQNTITKWNETKRKMKMRTARGALSLSLSRNPGPRRTTL